MAGWDWPQDRKCGAETRVLGQSCGKSSCCPTALIRPSATLWLVGVAGAWRKFDHVSPPCQLLVWNHSSLSPVQQYTEHLAAVKAIAWSPHQHGLLASGGGTADRCIRFWNTLTGQPLQCIDTGSQVCNLAWSKHANELVSSSPHRPAAELPCVQQRDTFPSPLPGEYPRILAEPDPRLEIPLVNSSSKANRALVPSPISGKPCLRKLLRLLICLHMCQTETQNCGASGIVRCLQPGWRSECCPTGDEKTLCIWFPCLQGML